MWDIFPALKTFLKNGYYRSRGERESAFLKYLSANHFPNSPGRTNQRNDSCSDTKPNYSNLSENNSLCSSSRYVQFIPLAIYTLKEISGKLRGTAGVAATAAFQNSQAPNDSHCNYRASGKQKSRLLSLRNACRFVIL